VSTVLILPLTAHSPPLSDGWLASWLSLQVKGKSLPVPVHSAVEIREQLYNTAATGDNPSLYMIGGWRLCIFCFSFARARVSAAVVKSTTFARVQVQHVQTDTGARRCLTTRRLRADAVRLSNQKPTQAVSLSETWSSGSTFASSAR
jgi:hypothetical protein